MKRLGLHLGLVLVMALAGGWLGRRTLPSPPPSAPTRGPAPPVMPGMSGRTEAWRAQLAAVRAVPGSMSEIAWLKWAFAIPDEDVPAAIAALNPQVDFHALRYLYARWVKRNPAAAWESFRRSAIPAESSQFYPEAGQDSRDNLVYNRMTSSPRSLIAARMVASWIQTDPPAAAAFLRKFEDPTASEIEGIPLRRYERQRLEKMVSESDSGGPRPTIIDFAGQWASALANSAEGAQGRQLAGTVREWLERDAEAAGRWLLDLPQEQRALLNAQEVHYHLRETAPGTAAPLLLTLLHDNASSDEALVEQVHQALTPEAQRAKNLPTTTAIQSLQRWVHEDAPAALAYLDSMADSDFRAVLTGHAAGALVRIDPQAAVALLNEMPGDQALAVPELVRAWTATDAEATLRWVEHIEDPDLRAAGRETALLAWAAADPSRAVELATQSGDPALRANVIDAARQALRWNPAALRRWQAEQGIDE